MGTLSQSREILAFWLCWKVWMNLLVERQKKRPLLRLNCLNKGLVYRISVLVPGLATVLTEPRSAISPADNYSPSCFKSNYQGALLSIQFQSLLIYFSEVVPLVWKNVQREDHFQHFLRWTRYTAWTWKAISPISRYLRELKKGSKNRAGKTLFRKGSMIKGPAASDERHFSPFLADGFTSRPPLRAKNQFAELDVHNSMFLKNQ
jgi:hypothetical protein